MAKRPTCDTPGCGRPIPKGGEGHPEICPTCLACLRLHNTPPTLTIRASERKRIVERIRRMACSLDPLAGTATWQNAKEDARFLLGVATTIEEES